MLEMQKISVPVAGTLPKLCNHLAPQYCLAPASAMLHQRKGSHGLLDTVKVVQDQEWLAAVVLGPRHPLALDRPLAIG